MSSYENQQNRTPWDARLVVYWPDGEPLDSQGQTTVSHHLRTLPSITGRIFEATPDVPFVQLDFSVPVYASEVQAAILEANESAETSSASRREELAGIATFKKALPVALGALASVGIEPEAVELAATYAVNRSQLVTKHRELVTAHREYDGSFVAASVIENFDITRSVLPLYTAEQEAYIATIAERQLLQGLEASKFRQIQ